MLRHNPELMKKNLNLNTDVPRRFLTTWLGGVKTPFSLVLGDSTWFARVQTPFWLGLGKSEYRCASIHCNTLWHTATHCNTLQHTATHCKTLQHTATHLHSLKRAETHWNIVIQMCIGYFFNVDVQRTSLHVDVPAARPLRWLQHAATHCNTLQHTATHCNTLQRQRIYICAAQHRGRKSWFKSMYKCTYICIGLQGDEDA